MSALSCPFFSLLVLSVPVSSSSSDDFFFAIFRCFLFSLDGRSTMSADLLRQQSMDFQGTIIIQNSLSTTSADLLRLPGTRIFKEPSSSNL